VLTRHICLRSGQVSVSGGRFDRTDHRLSTLGQRDTAAAKTEQKSQFVQFYSFNLEHKFAEQIPLRVALTWGVQAQKVRACLSDGWHSDLHFIVADKGRGTPNFGTAAIHDACGNGTLC
jgi:hypothetical protein